jgi:hypothetical protein
VNQPQLIEEVMNRVNGKQQADKGALDDELKQIEKEVSEFSRKKSKYFKVFEGSSTPLPLLMIRFTLYTITAIFQGI